MNDLTLYRKYRPQDFESVIGQEEIVSILENSIKNNTFSHAYLFSGTRGCGKTSLARIFSKQLGVHENDIYEIDGASNRKIEDIREIRNSVSILPLNSKYKVYIIDEAHMLTKEASNALLKTLEEPPAHVIFILATTEKEKFLDTIISRCQVLDFKDASFSAIKKLISKIAKKEKIKIDEESLSYIADQSRGSFRDSVSILQKIITLLGNKINFNDLKVKLKPSNKNLENDFLQSLDKGGKEDAFAVYFKIYGENFNPKLFLENILEKIRIILLINNSNDFYKKYKKQFSEDEFNFFNSLENINSLHLKKVLEILNNIDNTSNPSAYFEISISDLF